VGLVRSGWEKIGSAYPDLVSSYSSLSGRFRVLESVIGWLHAYGEVRVWLAFDRTGTTVEMNIFFPTIAISEVICALMMRGGVRGVLVRPWTLYFVCCNTQLIEAGNGVWQGVGHWI